MLDRAEATADDTAWRLAGLPGPMAEAAYLSAANATQFRLIVTVVAEQQAHRLTGVTAEELPALIARHLGAEIGPQQAQLLVRDDSYNLTSRLSQLVRWGTFEQWQDEARTDEDFLRNRERYQLTERGAAIHRLAAELEQQTDATMSTAVLAPPIISAQLFIANEALALGDIEKAALAVAQIQTTMADMAGTAAQWQSRLAAGLGGAPTEDKITRLRQTVTAYVEMWGSGVDVYSASIAASATDLLNRQPSPWRQLALNRLGGAAEDDALAPVAAEIETSVRTVLAWFEGADGQAGRLRRRIRDTVAPLLRGHRTLLAVGGAVSRRAELLSLAARLDRAVDDAEAWRLWCAATGLYPARHLTLLAPEPAISPDWSCWAAAPAAVQSRLRRSGPRALAGNPALVPNTRRQRDAARAAANADRARIAAAEAALAARSGTRLSEWSALDHDEADLLLDLLATAHARPAPANGVRQAVSGDGRWTARFHPVTPRASAVVALPTGRLVVEDALVEVGR